MRYGWWHRPARRHPRTHWSGPASPSRRPCRTAKSFPSSRRAIATMEPAKVPHAEQDWSRAASTMPDTRIVGFAEVGMSQSWLFHYTGCGR
jgi:hypothetical protein